MAASAAPAGTGSVWNQNSWHWEEREVTAWAHEDIKTRLRAIEVTKDGVSARVSDIPELKGAVRSSRRETDPWSLGI